MKVFFKVKFLAFDLVSHLFPIGAKPCFEFVNPSVLCFYVEFPYSLEDVYFHILFLWIIGWYKFPDFVLKEFG